MLAGMGPLEPEAAWKLLRPHLRALPAQRLTRRAALGRVLAEGVAARTDMPAHDVSAMDGYAAAGDVPVERPLRVVGTVAAGDAPGARLEDGQAVYRIMTGAPVPSACDRVIPIERTDRGTVEVVLHDRLEAGANIRRRAEVVRAGEPLLEAGTALEAPTLSLLAAHGVDRVSVHRSPTVAVVSTGDEVVAPEREPQPGQLRDSHTDFLLAAGRRLGLEFTALGIAPDEPEALAALLAAGMESDVLIVCGGVSAGEFDLVEPALARLGWRTLFDRVLVQPGQPLVGAVHESTGRLAFGLPGNPASSIVCFHLFVRPALRALMGHDDSYWKNAFTARLGGPLPGAKSRHRFLPALAQVVDGMVVVTPIRERGSHDLVAYGQAQALVQVPAGAQPRVPGDSCQALLL
jgi:molybdopterin molybdotransferase